MNAYGGAQQPASAMLQHAYMPPPHASRQQHSMYGGYPDVGGSHHQQVPPSILPPPPQPGHHQVHGHAAAPVPPRAPRENHGCASCACHSQTTLCVWCSQSQSCSLSPFLRREQALSQAAATTTWRSGGRECGRATWRDVDHHHLHGCQRSRRSLRGAG